MLGNSYLFYTEEELIFRIWYSYTTLRVFNTFQALDKTPFSVILGLKTHPYPIVILGRDGQSVPSIHRSGFDMDSRNKSENDI